MKTDTFNLNGKQIKKRTIPDLPQNLKLRDYARENRKGYNDVIHHPDLVMQELEEFIVEHYEVTE